VADVWELEEQGWQAIAAGTPDEFYDKVLTEDAVMVLPGMVLDRGQVLDSWRDAPPWTSYELTDRRTLRPAPEVAIVVYRATAERPGGVRYEALMSSVYVKASGEWRLACHQQTPVTAG
jgi:uncharacterized protein (TIGR02246 family)